MSKYEYTDPTGFILNVWGNTHYTYIASKRSEREEPFGVYLPNEDAPAVALAILEAAGIEGWGDSDDRLSGAVVALTEHKRQQDAKAEREAEDAKVRKFFSTMWPTAYHNTGRVTDMMRTEYNAARKFFEGS